MKIIKIRSKKWDPLYLLVLRMRKLRKAEESMGVWECGVEIW